MANEAPHLVTRIGGNDYFVPLTPAVNLKWHFEINSSTVISAHQDYSTGLTSSDQAHILVEFHATVSNPGSWFNIVHFKDANDLLRASVYTQKNDTGANLKIASFTTPSDTTKWARLIDKDYPCFWLYTDSQFPLSYCNKVRIVHEDYVTIHRLVISLW